MKVIALNYSDVGGGAARAAYRVHRALLENGIGAKMWVVESGSSDSAIIAQTSTLAKVRNSLQSRAARGVMRLLKTDNPVLHSPAFLPSYHFVRSINRSGADIVHLHWVAGEVLSIEDIGRIKKPIVWTMHDMWPFCGAEHLADDTRWRDGYRRGNRPLQESGLDLNRWAWRRKKRAWRRKITIVAPSRWMADCVRRSALMRDWPVTVIPNPLDTDLWRPVAKGIARSLLGFSHEGPLILFGSAGQTTDFWKGVDLLRGALRQLARDCRRLQLVVFGPHRTLDLVDSEVSVRNAGYFHDELSLRILYSAADVLVVPSRIETFCQVASEALACATPVVGFDNTGLRDVVDHQESGYLAQAFDVQDLARGIKWVVGDRQRQRRLADWGRQEAVKRFSFPVVAQAYARVYKDAIASNEARDDG